MVSLSIKNTAIIQQNISMSPFLQMDRVQDFTHGLHDSSSDSAEETPFFNPERVSQKLRRRSCRPVSLFFFFFGWGWSRAGARDGARAGLGLELGLGLV